MDATALERAARERLDELAYGYIAMSAGDAAKANVEAWSSLRLRPRVLRDVSEVSTSTTVLGTTIASPIMVAPTAMHRLACADGELATARAAARTNTLYVISMVSTTSVEDIAAAAPGAPRWMQLCVLRDRGRTRHLCERAAAAGCSAIVVTVDAAPPRPGTLPPPERPLNADLALPNLAPDANGPVDIHDLILDFDGALTFDDLAQVADWSGLPVAVKGVLRGDDAARCIEAGARAVIVSNHGGRLLEGCITTAVALGDVVEAVGGAGEVYVDGGIRSGSDVVKALALGARAVLVGRPVLWGLAANGAEGAAAVLSGLQHEFDRALTLCGIADATAVPSDIVTSLSC